MATTCSNCGTSLTAGAAYCSACGQAVVAGPPKQTGAAQVGAKRMPVAALVVLIGGFVAVLAAALLYRSGALVGPGSAAPTAAAEQAGQSAAAANPAEAGSETVAAAAAPQPGDASAAASAAAAPGPGTAPPPGAQPAPSVESAPAAKPAPPPVPPPFRKTYECREYATFKIDPDTTIVTVDGEVIGIADEWADTPRTEKYKFKNEGVHYVKLSHRDYETLWLRFIVSQDALDKTAIVEYEMKKKKDKDEE